MAGLMRRMPPHVTGMNLGELGELLCYGLYRAGGLAALFALRYACVALAAALLLRYARLRQLSMSATLLAVVFLSILGALTGTILKPEILSFVAFYALVFAYAMGQRPWRVHLCRAVFCGDRCRKGADALAHARARTLAARPPRHAAGPYQVARGVNLGDRREGAEAFVHELPVELDTLHARSCGLCHPDAAQRSAIRTPEGSYRNIRPVPWPVLSAGLRRPWVSLIFGICYPSG